MPLKISLLTALFLGATLTSGAIAQRYQSDEPDYSEYHPVYSIDAYANSPNASAEALCIAVEYANKAGNYDQAIAICRRALRIDYDDLDIHLAFAEALENKIKDQDERDEKLFKECVKEWLIVLHNTVGAEKGLTWHGLSLPGMEKRYEDPMHGGVARTHLKALVGSLPKASETDARYLKRVLNQADSTVSGKVVDSDRNKQH